MLPLFFLFFLLSLLSRLFFSSPLFSSSPPPSLLFSLSSGVSNLAPPFWAGKLAVCTGFCRGERREKRNKHHVDVCPFD